MDFLRRLLAAVILATTLDLAYSAAGGFLIRTDRLLLLAVMLAGHLLTAGAALLLLKFALRWLPVISRLWVRAPWGIIGLAVATALAAPRIRRLSAPLSLLPEMSLVLTIGLVLFVEWRRGGEESGRPGWPSTLAAIFACGLLAQGVLTYPLPGREMLAAPRADGGTPSGPAQPNLILIVLDTLRADRLGLYGHNRPTSPFLDSLARRSLVFDHAVSASSWTLPAHATLFTGLDSWAHGADIVEEGASGLDVSQLDRVKDPMRVRPLPQGATTLAEVAHAAGLETAAICGNSIYLYRVFQLDQGFDTYVDALGIELSRLPVGLRLAQRLGLLDWWPFRRASMRNEQLDRHAHEVNRLALEWLEPRRSRRFFLFLNYMDVHGPYFMPLAYSRLFPLSHEEGEIDRDAILSRRRAILPRERTSKLDSYDAEIRYLDDQLAHLFSRLGSWGLLDNTVVLITSDHGESFGEHHELGHGNSVYESEVRIPMLLLRPDENKPGRVGRTVHLAEVYATLLEELGLPLPNGAPDRRLDDPEPVRPPIAFVTWWPPMAGRYERYKRSHSALYEAPWKLIAHSDGTEELYDIVVDPREMEDLSAAEPDTARRLLGALEEVQRRTLPRFQGRGGRLDEETLRRLRSLGYLD